MISHSWKWYAKKAHLWLALPAGWIITITALTGAMLVYQTQIERAIYPERFQNSSSKNGQADWEDRLNLAKNGLKGDTIEAISLSSDPSETALLKLSSAPRLYASINRNSGEVQSIYNSREGTFYTIKKLHRWLMDESRTTGRWIVGTSSIFLAFVLLSGCAIWIPKRAKQWATRWRIHLHKGAWRILFDLHCVLGGYAATLLLLLCLTGPIWSFSWYYRSVATLFQIETKGEEPRDNLDNTTLNSEKEWAIALHAVHTQIPNARYYTLRKDGKVTILPNKSSHEMATDEYRYNPSNQQLSLTSKYGATRDDRFFMEWVDVLHTGRFGGEFIRFFTFLSALIGASLPITGYILYFKLNSTFKKRGTRSKTLKGKLSIQTNI